jgi:hypothetical protein
MRAKDEWRRLEEKLKDLKGEAKIICKFLFILS